jgi:hypothetical protein
MTAKADMRRPAISAGRTCGIARIPALVSGVMRIRNPRPETRHAMLPPAMKDSPPIITVSVTSGRRARTRRMRSTVFSS